MPGTIIGAFVVDYLGPKWTMITGLLVQAFFGFIMSGLYSKYIVNFSRERTPYSPPLCRLVNHIAAFAVRLRVSLSCIIHGMGMEFRLYMAFSSASESLVSGLLLGALIWSQFDSVIGPGNCLGLLASKSSPTAVRGQFYGTAAAIGKAGAFVRSFRILSHYMVDSDPRIDRNRRCVGTISRSTPIDMISCIFPATVFPFIIDGKPLSLIFFTSAFIASSSVWQKERHRR
jgi:hypothetical protein